MALGSLRGDPTEAERLLARCHQLPGNGTLDEAQLGAFVGQLSALAVVVLDAYLEQRNRKSDSEAVATDNR